jgi:hypothetical protein
LLACATAIHQSAAWAALREQAAALEGHHLRELIVDKERCAALTAEHGAILLDYSRQRVTNETMDMLFNLAEVLIAIACCSLFELHVSCFFAFRIPARKQLAHSIAIA